MGEFSTLNQLSKEAGMAPIGNQELTTPTGGDDLLQSFFEESRRSVTSPDAYENARQAREGVGLLEKAGVTGMNAVLKLLDVLNTPQQLLFGAGIGLTKGEDLMEAALEGARNNVTGSDLLEALGVGELGTFNVPLIGQVTGRGVVGLPLDFLIDIPVFGALSKVAKFAGLPKLAGRAGEAIKTGGKALRAKDPRLDAVLGQFRTFATKNEKVLMDLSMETGRVGKGKQGAIKKVVQEFAEKIEQTAVKEGAALPQFTRTLRDLIERKTGTQGSLNIKAKDFSFDSAKGKPFQTFGGETISKSQKAAEDTIKATYGKQANFKLMAEDVETIAVTRKAMAAAERKTVAKGMRAELDKIDVSEGMAELVTEGKRLLDDGILQEINHGLGTLALDDAWVDYLPHLLTPAARKILRNEVLDVKTASRSPVFSGAHSSQLLRKWKGHSISELEQFGKRGILPGMEGTVIDDLFISDPTTAIGMRLIRGQKSMTDAEMFFQTAKKLGRTTEELKVVGANTDDFVKLKIVGTQDDRLKPLASFLDNFHFEKDVATHMDAYYKVITEPRAFSEFLGAFDQIQGIWKASTLFIFPGYHARNMVGNWWNNFLAGTNVKHYGTAQQWQSGKINSVNLGHKGIVAREQMDEVFTKYGIMNQFREFLAIPEVRIGQRLSDAGALGRVPVIGKGTEVGIKLGNAIENNARIAHFFDRVIKGDSYRDAALSVKKHLFNYDELTKVEQSIMRRAFPFYAWTRNNLPLQIRSLVEQPQKFAQLGDVVEFVNGRTGKPQGEDAFVQEWMRDQTPVRTRIDSDGNAEYFLLGGWLPAGDIGKIVQPFKILEDELTPFIKAPFEIASGFSLFMDRKIEDFPGQKEKFVGVRMRKRATTAARNIRLLTTLDTLLAAGEGAFREGETGILTDRRAKSIADTTLSILMGVNMRTVDRKAAKRQVDFQIRELKGLLRRERRKGNEANAEKVRDELLDLTDRLRR